MVECKICGRDCGIAITRKHLSFYHNMSLDEYKSLYGKDICWNTGLTKETNSKVADMYGEEFGKKISAANLVTWKDPKTRKKRIQSLKDGYKTQDNTERNKNISIGSLRAFQDPIKRENKLRHIRSGNHLRKAILNGFKPENNTRTVVKFDNDLGHYVRSSWERKFGIFLKENNIEYQYEPRRFDLKDCFYLPDFYIPSLDCFIELTGYSRPKKKYKVSKMGELYPEINLIEFTDLNKAMDYIGEATNKGGEMQ